MYLHKKTTRLYNLIILLIDLILFMSIYIDDALVEFYR